MILQQVNRDDAETIFGNFTNKSGGTVTKGYAVAFATGAASNDGNKGVVATTTHLATFAGIADADSADNAVARYQAYGYNGSVFYFAEATSVSLTAPDHGAGPGPSSLGVGATGLSFVLGPVVTLVSIGAVIRSAGGYIKGFIRAM